MIPAIRLYKIWNLIGSDFGQSNYMEVRIEDKKLISLKGTPVDAD